MSNDQDAFACGYAFGMDHSRRGLNADDLPEDHAVAVRERFGFSGEIQWWAGFDRARWWFGSTTETLHRR